MIDTEVILLSRAFRGSRLPKPYRRDYSSADGKKKRTTTRGHKPLLRKVRTTRTDGSKSMTKWACRSGIYRKAKKKEKKSKENDKEKDENTSRSQWNHNSRRGLVRSCGNNCATRITECGVGQKDEGEDLYARGAQ